MPGSRPSRSTSSKSSSPSILESLFSFSRSKGSSSSRGTTVVSSKRGTRHGDPRDDGRRPTDVAETHDGIPVQYGSAAHDVIHNYCLRLPKRRTFRTQMSFIIEDFQTQTPRFSYVKLNPGDPHNPWVETGLHRPRSRSFPIEIAISWNISDASWAEIKRGTRVKRCDLPRSGINREGILCELSDQVVQCSQSQLENGHGYSLNICVDFSLGIERSQNEMTGAATNHRRMGYASSASTRGPSSIKGASYRGDGSIVSGAYPRSEPGSDYSRGKSHRGNGSIVSGAYPPSERSTTTRASRRTKDWVKHAGY